MQNRIRTVCLLTLTVLLTCAAASGADETDTKSSPAGAAPENTKPDQRPRPRLKPLTPLPKQLAQILESAGPLNTHNTAFLDMKKKRLLLRTEVACEDCLLEMLCCLEQTKEHESILWFRGQAKTVHAGLLALNAKPGTHVVFTPEFKPPAGHTINIFVNWVDMDGKLQRADARTWMRQTVNRYYSHKLAKLPTGIKVPYMELRYDPYNKEILWFGPMSEKEREHLLTLSDEGEYQKAIQKFFHSSQSRPMTAEFVFSGSYHVEREAEEGSKVRAYAAEGGFLVCVANFAQSTIDVREASSASEGGHSYEGWEGKVPPPGTPVILELIPAEQSPQP